MNIRNFYSFESKLLSTTIQVHPENISLNKLNDLVLGKFKDINFPIIFRQKYGKKQTDLVDTGSAYLYLISERLLNVLKQNKITGWQIYPVIVYDRNNLKIEGYHGFSIAGISGAIDYSKSEIIKKRLVSGGPKTKYYKGQYFGYEQWDGSDFFITEGSFHIIVTKKVMEVIKKAKLTNIQFDCLADIEIPIYSIKKK